MKVPQKDIMTELFQMAVILFLVVAFFSLFALLAGWKFHTILKHLNEVIKLEVKSPPGRISLVTNFLIVVLFIIVFMSHEAGTLLKAFLKPELEVSSFDARLGLLIVVFSFSVNLVVLAYLEKNKKKS
jgi:hypothetical protein